MRDTIAHRHCLIHVDMDSQQTLLRFYGFQAPATPQTDFLRHTIPRFIALFDRLGVKASFFVCGADYPRQEDRRQLQLLVDAGHELADHTYSHLFGLSGLDQAIVRADLVKNREFIWEVCGQAPAGFRAPGYDIDDKIMDMLAGLGYLYDSSVLPTSLATAYKLLHWFKTSDKQVSGGMGEPKVAMRAPYLPYRPVQGALWQPSSDNQGILEIPLSVVPVLRLPFYTNFLFLFGRYGFDALFPFVRRLPIITFLLHAADLVDPAHDGLDPRLSRHPNLSKPLHRKMQFLEHCLQGLAGHYAFSTSRDYLKEQLRT